MVDGTADTSDSDTHLAALLSRIGDRSAKVAVVGQGYVGLSVAIAAATAGFTTAGVDLDVERITALSAGQLVVAGVDDATFATAMATGHLRFGSGFDTVSGADVVLICVPTPLVEHRPDLTSVERAAAAIGEKIAPGALVVLESTTYPGTTEQIVVPLLEAGGRVTRSDVLVAYSPERINPGDTAHPFATVPRVVGGLTPGGTTAAAAFYGTLVDVVHPVSGCRAAELAKLLENTFRLVNIALVNELAQLCADQGIDVWEVIDAAATKPFGFMPFFPGPGVGGHCIPLDPTYLTWQSRRDTGRPFRLVEMAADINNQMPTYVARRIMDALNDRGIAVPGAQLLALGVTYKADVGDVRESAALEVLDVLARRGAAIAFHDPFVEEICTDGELLHRVDLTTEALAGADAVLLLTPHADYDVDVLLASASLLFDARNAAAERTAPNLEVL